MEVCTKGQILYGSATTTGLMKQAVRIAKTDKDSELAAAYLVMWLGELAHEKGASGKLEI